VYEIASRPSMKPNVRAPPGCSSKRASTKDCRAGQRPHLHLAGDGRPSDAGAGRIQQTRHEAAKRGLDPNV
jgi:hypothetical protein